jgi:hypothetical protein
MITAKEARERLMSIESEKNAKQLSVCEEVIMKAIHNCNVQVSVDFWITDPVQEFLLEKGYKVERGSSRNESYTIISWKE